MLAAKTAISVRVDALGEQNQAEVGIAHRAKLEARIRQLESRTTGKGFATPRNQTKYVKNKTYVMLLCACLRFACLTAWWVNHYVARLHRTMIVATRPSRSRQPTDQLPTVEATSPRSASMVTMRVKRRSDRAWLSDLFLR
jgi:hypothetical protein